MVKLLILGFLQDNNEMHLMRITEDPNQGQRRDTGSSFLPRSTLYRVDVLDSEIEV